MGSELSLRTRDSERDQFGQVLTEKCLIKDGGFETIMPSRSCFRNAGTVDAAERK